MTNNELEIKIAILEGRLDKIVIDNADTEHRLIEIYNVAKVQNTVIADILKRERDSADRFSKIDNRIISIAEILDKTANLL